MNHGTVVVKENLVSPTGDVWRHVGEQGVITAYLPEDNIYAVMFDGQMGVGNWFTMDLVSFEKFFDVLSLTL